uniref:Ig-like domain-containing protein n=1 Tax=Oryzias latipes TaxID=8090 RepID=A0A3P9KC44_ORYLA
EVVVLNIQFTFNMPLPLSKHVLQQHSGCEWDDETGETKSFNRYAYDGEDFPKLDLLKHEWTALTEKALATKLTWENNKVIFFFSVVLPSVSLLQRSNSSLVSCHATGFFPDMVDLFWMKDGEEFHEDVEKGEILPHNDETFQMSIYLNTSSLPLTDWKKFSCVFQLFRNQKNITISLDKTKIRTNKATYSMSPALIVVSYLFLWLTGIRSFTHLK